MVEVQNMKTVSVNVSRALFSIFTYKADMAMKALVRLVMVLLRAIRFGVVKFSNSYAN
jgi:hypothetical protein